MVCDGGDCRAECGSTVCRPGEVCEEGECREPGEDCGGISCEFAPECQDADDCPSNLACVDDRCQPGPGSLGDPCDEARDCFSSTCSDEGRCATPCSSNEHCNSDFSCHAGACVPDEKGALGDPCADARDCVGEQCVADLTPVPVCTRQCEGDFEPCPADWECDAVEGRRVCVPGKPLVVKSGSACSVSVEPVRNPGLSAVFLLAGVGAGVRRRTRVVRQRVTGTR
jgi:hypothetical protein